MGQTATERLNRAKSSKRVLLKTDFAGLNAGSSMFVATPKIVDDYVNQLPVGQFISMPELRADLAIEHDCDATCPLTTAIFLRLVAEAALEPTTDESSKSGLDHTTATTDADDADDDAGGSGDAGGDVPPPECDDAGRAAPAAGDASDGEN